MCIRDSHRVRRAQARQHAAGARDAAHKGAAVADGVGTVSYTHLRRRGRRGERLTVGPPARNGAVGWHREHSERSYTCLLYTSIL